MVIRLKVRNPSGHAETTVVHAPRLDTLVGKTICELSNGVWEHERIFPYLREQLLAKYPTARFIPSSEVVESRVELEDLDHLAAAIKAKGCQAVITGMAA